MARPRPLTLVSIPKISRKQPLSQMHDWAGLLGFFKLANEDAEDLAHFIALARPTSPSNDTPSIVSGLTRRRRIAELKRWAKKLRREQQTGVQNEYLRRLMADPHLGLDTLTCLRLAPLTAGPASELLAAVETRMRELELEPDADPQHEALESAGGAALWFFLLHAADSVCDEAGAWWRFVLAFLDAAGFPTEGLYQHPERLRPLLDKMRAAVEPCARAIRAALPFLRLCWRSPPEGRSRVRGERPATRHQFCTFTVGHRAPVVRQPFGAINLEEPVNKLLYRAGEARAAIGCGVTKFYQLVNSGMLDARRFGRRTYITGASLERFVETLTPVVTPTMARAEQPAMEADSLNKTAARG